MFGSIEEYGPFAVILGVVLIVVIALIVNMQNTVNKFIEQSLEEDKQYKQQIMDQNNAIVEQLLNTKQEILDSQRPTLNVKDLQSTFDKLNRSIKDYCRQCMDEIKAKRLGIYLFHNGTYSLTGIHFFKMSCICEKVAIGSGVRERAIEHSSIPINLFDDMITGLMNDGYYIINRPNSKEELESSNIKIFFSSSKIEFIYTVAIYDNDNNIIGFVLAEMMKDENLKDLADFQYKKIKELVAKITPVLLFSNYINIDQD
jgi:RNA polymerase-binding transcription factor DksA